MTVGDLLKDIWYSDLDDMEAHHLMRKVLNGVLTHTDDVLTCAKNDGRRRLKILKVRVIATLTFLFFQLFIFYFTLHYILSNIRGIPSNERRLVMVKRYILIQSINSP